VTEQEDKDRRKREEEAAALALLLIRRRRRQILTLNIQQQFQSLLDQYAQIIRVAYVQAVEEAVSSVKLADVEALVVRGDADGIARLVTGVPFNKVLDGIRQAYFAGGDLEVTSVPASIRRPFDNRGDSVDAWIRQTEQQVMQTIQQNQRDAIGRVTAAALLRGQPARKTALQILGTRSKQTGRRSGGVVGLTGQDATWVEAARQQLESGDPVQMKAYLTRKNREKTYDKVVTTAIAAAVPVAAGAVAAITAAYSAKLVPARAETEAEPLAQTSVSAGRAETLNQVKKANPTATVTKEWRTQRDNKVRHTHAAMNGQRRNFDQPFQSPAGSRMMQPGDRSYSADDSEIYGCRCGAVYSVKLG
jgi:hypothetical protein